MIQAAAIFLVIAGAARQDDDPYESALAAAIHHFASEGELDHLRAIVERHPRLVDARAASDPARKPTGASGYTALHRAADRGRAEVAEYLLGRGADVNAADGAGWTPLHVAARAGRLDVVKLLVSRGADVGARTAPVPETSSNSLPGSAGRAPGVEAEPPVKYPAVPGRTALEWAAAMKREDVVEYLESVGK